MESRLITALHYRTMAEKMRDMANQEANPKAREKLLRLAELFVQLSQKVLGRPASPT
jgi:hypothetical protein